MRKKEKLTLDERVQLYCMMHDKEKKETFLDGYSVGYEDCKEELEKKVCLSIDCEKAQKDEELCLGYGGDEDEPCERCKNCIKCECGYYQLGETEKDEQLTKAKELLKRFIEFENCTLDYDDIKEAEHFISEVEK